MKNMRKSTLILTLILIWVCIAAVLIAGNILIISIVNPPQYKPVFRYTSLLASYLVQPGMQEDVATSILGGESLAASGLKMHAYSFIGGGSVGILINTKTGTVQSVTRQGELACWIFYGLLYAVAMGEVILYKHLRKKQVKT